MVTGGQPPTPAVKKPDPANVRTTTPTTAVGANNYGTQLDLSTESQAALIRASYAKAGKSLDDGTLNYILEKVQAPQQFSDGKWRVGWNAYWESRMLNASAAADPNLAGTEGIVADAYLNGGNPGASTTTSPSSSSTTTAKKGTGSAAYEMGKAARAKATANGTTPGTPPLPGQQANDSLVSAYAAMARARKTAAGAGRASTVLGGFGGGSPTTARPTLLGS